MLSKTPQFNKAIADYFTNLPLDEKGGQWRTCRFSGERFYVRPEDAEFYQSMRVPLPTLSPAERTRCRLAAAPSYFFFRGVSAATGKPVVTVYPPSAPVKIFEHEFWMSDAWSPMDYGRGIEAGKSFFEQFAALQRDVPRPNLNSHPSNINSEFTNNSVHLKNCYLTFDAIKGENLYYFECCLDNKDCVDCWAILSSDTCYKASGERLYKAFFCERTYDTVESYFLYDCRNCTSCFMSSNLRNKSYYFYNQPLSKEEYQRRMAAVNLGNYHELQRYQKDYEAMKLKAFHRNLIAEHSTDSLGHWMFNCKNCYKVLFAFESENVAYSLGFGGSKDSYDIVGGINAERCYELMTVSSEKNYNVKFSSFIDLSTDVEYSDLCRNCSNCFGCAGLSNRSYCIFNKQYTEEEYWKKVDEIKTAMLLSGEYGEFFPPGSMILPYNASFNMAYIGFQDVDNARRYGYRIDELPDDTHSLENPELIAASQLPDDIRDVDDTILQKQIFDEKHNKRFRITPYELEFYRKHNLALPRTYPFMRMQEWRKNFDARLTFYDRSCAKCGRTIKTAYAPDAPEKNIYCEQCYVETIG